MAGEDNIPAPDTPAVSLNPAQQSAAQSKAAILAELRKKFGVTFHSNMDLKTLAAQWNAAVANDASLVEQYATVTAAMAEADATVMAQDIVVMANQAAKEATNIATIATTVIASANPLSPNPSYAGTELASGITAIALKAEAAAIDAATSALITLLEKVPPLTPPAPLPPPPQPPPLPVVPPISGIPSSF